MSNLVVHVVGARPNFPKADPVMKALDAFELSQELVHTGQHYDDAMSAAFFRDLDIRTPDIALGIGSGTQADQTGRIMVGLETLFADTRPSLVVVYGDVNSTIAAALVSAKLNIRSAHVEAGLRSFDASMPEEINRRVTDQLSDLLFVTSPEAIGNLAREGRSADSIYFVGNPMIDTLLRNRHKFDASLATCNFGVSGDYGVATLHRPGNVDLRADVERMVEALRIVSMRIPLIVPLHPRGRRNLFDAGLGNIAGVQVVAPLGYLDFMSLVSGARLVITDSGGVQEETSVLGVPCLTLRRNTERPITITLGTNHLVRLEDLPAAVDSALESTTKEEVTLPLWDGKAGTRIAAIIAKVLNADPIRHPCPSSGE